MYIYVCVRVRMYKHICTGEMSIANKSVITNQTWKKRSLPSPSPWPLPLVWPVIPSLHPPLLSLSLWRARARYTYTSMHAYTQACMPRHISTYVLCHTCVYKQILPAHTHTHTHTLTHTHTHTHLHTGRALDIPLTTTEAGQGLVPPAVAVHLLGQVLVANVIVANVMLADVTLTDVMWPNVMFSTLLLSTGKYQTCSSTRIASDML